MTRLKAITLTTLIFSALLINGFSQDLSDREQMEIIMMELDQEIEANLQTFLKERGL